MILRTALTLLTSLSSISFGRAQEAAPSSRPSVATLPAGKTSSSWVPMELHLDSYIYLKGRINGVETDVVLDSGAGATVIDASFADKLGLESRGSVGAKGVGGLQSAAFLDGVKIEVGDVTFQMPDSIRIDMSNVGKRLGRPMPVIIGREVFRDLVVDIDYPASRLAVHAPASFKYTGPGKTIPLYEAERGLRAVDLVIEGKGAARARIDTGSGSAIDLFRPFVQEHKLLEGRSPTSTRQGGGVGGKLTMTVGTLRSVSLAGFELKEVPAAFVEDGQGGAFDSDASDGNMGAGILKRFRVIFDYSRNEAHLEPGKDWDTRPFKKDRIGLQVVWDDPGLKVTYVSPNSPADKAGWKPGMHIKAVNGHDLRREGWRQDVSVWSNAPIGTEVTLTDGDGKVHKLVAADYY